MFAMSQEILIYLLKDIQLRDMGTYVCENQEALVGESPNQGSRLYLIRATQLRNVSTNIYDKSRDPTLPCEKHLVKGYGCPYTWGPRDIGTRTTRLKNMGARAREGQATVCLMWESQSN